MKNQRISTALLAAYVALTIGASSCSSQSEMYAEVQANTTCTLKVQGMTCATCPAQVRTAIKRLPGVVAVQVTLSPPQATVQFDSEQINAQQLAAAPTDIGYPSEILACGKQQG